MKTFFSYLVLIFCLFTFTGCENEEENIVSSIHGLNFVIEDGILNISPVIGEDDNYTYTIVYSLDGKELGRLREYPFELKYELQSEDLAIGTHLIFVEFYGKYSGRNFELYSEESLSVRYTILENGELKNGDVEIVK